MGKALFSIFALCMIAGVFVYYTVQESEGLQQEHLKDTRKENPALNYKRYYLDMRDGQPVIIVE